MSRWIRSLLSRAPSPARSFPSSGFVTLPISEKVEEENSEWYSPTRFYPVRIGQVFESRYQVVSKVGFGSSSTVWLGRDLVFVLLLTLGRLLIHSLLTPCSDHRYVALKVCVKGYPSVARESVALERLRSLKKPSPWIQRPLNEFTIHSDDGNTQHKCFVLEPLSYSLARYTFFLEDEKWSAGSIRLATKHVFYALKDLHTKANLIHCGTS